MDRLFGIATVLGLASWFSGLIVISVCYSCINQEYDFIVLESSSQGFPPSLQVNLSVGVTCKALQIRPHYRGHSFQHTPPYRHMCPTWPASTVLHSTSDCPKINKGYTIHMCGKSRDSIRGYISGFVRSWVYGRAPDVAN